jgi:hypothetical protein
MDQLVEGEFAREPEVPEDNQLIVILATTNFT